MHSWHVFLPGSVELQPGSSHAGQCTKIMTQENLQPRGLGLSQLWGFFFFQFSSIREVSFSLPHPHGNVSILLGNIRNRNVLSCPWQCWVREMMKRLFQKDRREEKRLFQSFIRQVGLIVHQSSSQLSDPRNAVRSRVNSISWNLYPQGSPWGMLPVSFWALIIICPFSSRGCIHILIYLKYLGGSPPVLGLNSHFFLRINHAICFKCMSCALSLSSQSKSTSH